MKQVYPLMDRTTPAQELRMTNAANSHRRTHLIMASLALIMTYGVFSPSYSSAQTKTTTFKSLLSTYAGRSSNLKVSIAFSPGFPTEGQVVQFTDASVGNPVSWQWDFGDGTMSTVRNPTHVYTASGFRRVTLTAGNGTASKRASRTLTVMPAPSPATFVYSPSTPGPGQTVQFADTTSGSPTSWQWNFGDGSTSTAKNPTHAFLKEGSYGVTLITTVGSGQRQGGKTVTVARVSVLASSFNFPPASPAAGQSVQFTDASMGSPTSWLWNFGDGTSSIAQNPAHAYTTAGPKSVTLTVTNSSGSSSSSSRAVTVAAALTASFSFSPSSPTSGQAVQFTDLSSGNPASWAWSFGDGVTSTLQNPAHTFTTAGSKPVTLTVTNSAGSNSTSRTVVVTAPLTASYTFSPGAPVSSQAVQFTDTSIGSPSLWQWNFGDGSTSSSQNPSHAFMSAGSYSVALTVMNASTQNTVTQTINVAPANTLVAAFNYSPVSPAAGQAIQFTDASTGGPTSWSWAFGDGSTSTSRNPSHSYATTGSKAVTLTATNSAGSNSTTRTLTIEAAITADFAFSPGSPVAGQVVQFTDTSAGNPTSWLWDFNDGSTSTSKNPSHSFATAGSHSVILTASAGSGSSVKSRLINVAAAPSLTASFGYSPSSPASGQAVQFSDTSTGTPTSWQWTFGDGATSTQQSPVHAYMATGPYAVTLVVGNGSTSDSTNQTVTVAPASTIIPADRRIDWTYCGIPGGIPNRTTIYTTLNPGATAAQINSAIAACPSGQVVYLAAGTYTLTGMIDLDDTYGVTVRGAGAGQTIINSSVTGNIITTHETGFFSPLGIASGYTKGSTSIVMSDTPTDFMIGHLMKVYQDDDTTLVMAKTGPGKNLNTIHRITNKVGNTLTFTPPLPYTLTAGLNPTATTMPAIRATLTGIENLTLNSTGGSCDRIINMVNSDRCWIKGVETHNSDSSFIFIWDSVQCEVRRCYIHHALNSPANPDGYGVYLYGGSAFNLVEDNIFTEMFMGVLQTTSGCNAILYNYFWKMTAYSLNWQLQAMNSSHGAHPLMTLWEGNMAEQFQADGYHGSCSHQTLLRNWIHGLHPTNTANRKIVDLDRGSYYFNIVGNILGDSSWNPVSYEMTGQHDYTLEPSIYRLGYPNMGNNSLTNDDAMTTIYGLEYPDTKVASTLLRHGNYDCYNQTTVWDPAISIHTIPDSLFYSSKPSYFGFLQWPPIGPDVPGYVTDIPAKARWNAYLTSGRLRAISFRKIGSQNRPQSVVVEGQPVIVRGKWVKIASVHDEEWKEGQVVGSPELFLKGLKASNLEADIFTFCQKLPETQPKYSYYFEWDNAAAISLSTYESWWKDILSQDTRRNIRLANKRGVSIRILNIDDDLIRGIADIYNETPIRQGKRFIHYGKEFETVKKEHSTLLDRSEFLGAFYKDELIGFIKLVFMGPVAGILNIVSKISHIDKRPTNALISKAVEESIKHGASFLTYIKFAYGNKFPDSLAEFKRRNGFVQINYPRYYIPLTLKGNILLKLKLHRGLLGSLPPFIIKTFIGIRTKLIHATAERSCMDGAHSVRNNRKAIR